jgi:hypothetical protein
VPSADAFFRVFIAQVGFGVERAEFVEQVVEGTEACAADEFCMGEVDEYVNRAPPWINSSARAWKASYVDESMFPSTCITVTGTRPFSVNDLISMTRSSCGLIFRIISYLFCNGSG